MPKYLKPSFTISHLTNPMISLIGAAPVLGTRGRKSGQWRRVPVNVIERDGSLYLVAPRGYTHWARNLLANPEAELRRGRRTEKFQAVPVPVDQRLPLMATYLDRWGDASGGAVRGQFEQLPDPADHPTFRLIPSP